MIGSIRFDKSILFSGFPGALDSAFLLSAQSLALLYVDNAVLVLVLHLSLSSGKYWVDALAVAEEKIHPQWQPP